jgi:hypothetical protein
MTMNNSKTLLFAAFVVLALAGCSGAVGTAPPRAAARAVHAHPPARPLAFAGVDFQKVPRAQLDKVYDAEFMRVHFHARNFKEKVCDFWVQGNNPATIKKFPGLREVMVCYLPRSQRWVFTRTFWGLGPRAVGLPVNAVAQNYLQNNEGNYDEGVSILNGRALAEILRDRYGKPTGGDARVVYWTDEKTWVIIVKQSAGWSIRADFLDLPNFNKLKADEKAAKAAAAAASSSGFSGSSNK